jgi:hypothetical protein
MLSEKLFAQQKYYSNHENNKGKEILVMLKETVNQGKDPNGDCYSNHYPFKKMVMQQVHSK